MSSLLYIGPGLGVGTIVLILVIGGIVLFSFGYIIWLKAKKFFNKKD
jgi:TM2 domain-containing membrane protein YozV